MVFSYIGKKYSNNKGSNPFAIQCGGKQDKISKLHRLSWSEDVFISDSGEKSLVGKSFQPGKAKAIAFFLAFFMMLLAGKSAWLQIVKGDYYYAAAEDNRIRIERLEPRRGVIYDSEKRPLVNNAANFMLYFVPIDLPKEEEERRRIFSQLHAVMPEKSEESLKEIYASVKPGSLEAYRPLFVADNIEYEKAMKLYLLQDNWPGVILSNRTRRDYLVYGLAGPDGKEKYFHSASHIIGYTGKISPSELQAFGDEYLPIDYIGKMGVEYFWENEMKGKSGYKQIEVDALGKEKKIISVREPTDGNDLILSLDIMAQSKLEAILSANLEKLKLSKAAAIAMDPGSGEIIAMVNLPAYDNNVFARGITQAEYEILSKHPDKPLFNRSVSGEYPSGSTIKPVMAAAALQERIISENTKFLSTGGIRISQWFFPDWRAGGHGMTDVRKAIAESVNTFFYYIGGGHEDFTGLGVERIAEYEKLFGLGSQTGIDLAGEASGFLPSKEWKEEAKGEKWYIGDTYHLSIGQGDLLVTPLQVAAYTAVFANRGKLYRPHFLRQIVNQDQQTAKIPDNGPVRESFIDDYNLEVVRQGMRQTVTSGSARSLQALPVETAGKTGTAQWSTKKDPHAWFTGFAPYEKPRMVLTILIEEGKEGSTAAVPIAREFWQWYFEEHKKMK